MTERMKNIDTALVYQLWNEYADAINAGDLKRWMSVWTDDGIQMAPNTPPRNGKEQIRWAMQPVFDHRNMRNVIIHIEEVHILGDWSYSHGTYVLDLTPQESGETISFRGKFLDILVKQTDGSWKIAIGCYNYNESQQWISAAAGLGGF